MAITVVAHSATVYGLRGLGFGVWDLGFGVRGLGSVVGVWGLGCKVHLVLGAALDLTHCRCLVPGKGFRVEG